MFDQMMMPFDHNLEVELERDNSWDNEAVDHAVDNPRVDEAEVPGPQWLRQPDEPTTEQRELHELEGHVKFEPWCPCCISR